MTYVSEKGIIVLLIQVIVFITVMILGGTVIGQRVELNNFVNARKKNPPEEEIYDKTIKNVTIACYVFFAIIIIMYIALIGIDIKNRYYGPKGWDNVNPAADVGYGDDVNPPYAAVHPEPDPHHQVIYINPRIG
jgi:hypothetical protein